MKFIILLGTILLSNNLHNRITNTEISKYCNSRFGYCVDYPKFLYPQRESENGDGRVFKNKVGETVLTVFGRLNQDDKGNLLPIEKQYKIDIHQQILDRSIVEYQKLGKSFYVISGHRKGKIFYQKTIVKRDSFCFAILEYSQSEKEIYDSISTDVFKSFK